MKTVVLVMLLFLTLPGLSLFAQEQQIAVPYSLADRDRMVRVETQIEAMQSQINRLEDKFDSYKGSTRSLDLDVLSIEN